MLNEALDLARKGWYVFPVREKPGLSYEKNGETITPLEKQPYTINGLLDATRDESQIKAWWNTYPNAMIGINAGKSGLFVVDIDKKNVNGFDTFSQWKINDSAGWHTKTPTGGMHIIFTGTGKTSTNGKTGIDTRGEGGYFIVPPSKITEGVYTGEYTRFDEWIGTPGVIPDGLMSKLFPEETVEYTRSIYDGGEKKNLSRPTLTFITDGAVVGERNSNLFKAAADFAGCGYTQDEARDVLHPVCERIGLSRSECEQVIEHAYSKPRTPSIPDTIQEKIMRDGKRVAKNITSEEESIIEDALIACMLVDNTSVSIVNDILNYDDFQTLKNRLIYKTINKIRANSPDDINYVIVYNSLSKETEHITLDDLAKLVDKYGILNSDTVVAYANIIKEKSSLRKVEALMDNKADYLSQGSLLEVVSEIEKDLANIALQGGAKTTAVLDAEQAVDMVKYRTEKMRMGELEQLKIGFPMYDNIIGGLYPNELVISAGRAGAGKSALSLSILNHVSIQRNKPAVLFSLEMSTHESVIRLICQLTGLNYNDIYKGRLTEDEWKLYEEATQKISDSKLLFDDGFGISVPELRGKIRKLMDKDIELIVIDQLEQIRGYEALAPHLRFDKIAYEIKAMTQEFNVPIILNHQLNRAVTDRRLKDAEPQLSDLNQAGEKPANQVWAIVHKKDENGQLYDSKIKILKNRNGPTLDIPVLFLGERMLFTTEAIDYDTTVRDTKVIEVENNKEDLPWW